MIVVRLARGVTDHFMLRFPEWIGTAFLLRFSLTLATANGTFATSHSYDAMAEVADERVWAAAIGAVAVLRLAALVINGFFDWSRRRSPAVRSLTAGLSAGVWCAVAFGLYAANPAGTGWGTYSIIAMSEIALSLIIAKPAGSAYRAGRADGRP